MSTSSEIKSLIRNIAKNDCVTIFEAQIVNSEDNKCSIKYNGLTHENVRLVSGFSGENAPIIFKPSEGATVLVADLSQGKMRDLIVLMCSECDEVHLISQANTIDIDQYCISINGGGNGGLINIEDLTSKLNDLTNKFNSFVSTFNSHTHVVNTTGSATAQTGTAQAPTSSAQSANSFDKSDYEDTLVCH